MLSQRTSVRRFVISSHYLHFRLWPISFPTT